MAKVNQTPEERLEVLRLRVHNEALMALLHKNTKPRICARKIESNKGRVEKAIRVLEDANLIGYIGRDTGGYYGHPEKTYWVTGSFERYVDEYAAQANAQSEDVVRDHISTLLTKSRYNYGSCIIENLNMVGWIAIDKASISTLAYAWLHKDEYLFMDNKSPDRREKVDETPRTWDECKAPVNLIHRSVFEHLPKMLLRNAAEVYATNMYDYLALKDAGLKGWTEDINIGLSIVNVGKVKPCSTNMAILQDQCRKGIEVLKHYSDICSKVESAVERHGNQDNWRRAIMSLAIGEMLRAAPAILANADQTESIHPCEDRLQHINELSRYTLEHANLMSYETLFDDRVGTFEINEGIELNMDTQDAHLLSSGFKTLLYGSENVM